jgi:hypothetical protein
MHRRCLAVLLALGAACGQAASEPAESPASVEPPGAEPSALPPSNKRAPCTLGEDQTCNGDASVSALWGRCTELGVCECQAGFELDPLGRCQPAK